MGNNPSEKVETTGGVAEQESSILDRVELQSFVKDRKIKPEHFPLIEALAAFPKQMIIMELHNMFNMYKDRSAGELDRLLQYERDDEKKRLYETARSFNALYGWAVSWNLVRILEDL